MGKDTVETTAMVDQGTKALYGFDPAAVETIKNTVAKGATNHELALFLYTASKLGLDPLLQQIWFVKFKEGQPSIQVGRDGLLAIAQRDEGYETPVSQAVYSKDEFELDIGEGKVKHVIRDPGDRGVLIGAYCIAPHRNRKPVVTWVSYQEYAQFWGQKNPVWKSNPAEMIRKVAESQSLRRQYPDTGLSAVYVKDEFGPGEGEAVEAEAVDITPVSKDEIDALIAHGVAQGLKISEVKQAFADATSRKTLEGWSRDRAEFEAWKAKIEEAIARREGEAKAQQAKEKPKEKPAEAPPPPDLADAPTEQGKPWDLITDDQKQKIVELCCKLQEPGGIPLAWLKKEMGIEDISKLTQGGAADLILHLEEQVAQKRKGSQLAQQSSLL